jgi:hypothetical protein
VKSNFSAKIRSSEIKLAVFVQEEIDENLISGHTSAACSKNAAVSERDRTV